MTAPINSTPIGVENLVYATLIDDALATYGEVTNVAPLINVKITPKVSGDTLYADNRAVERVTTIGDIDVEIEASNLPLEIQAGLLGHTLKAIHIYIYHCSS